MYLQLWPLGSSFPTTLPRLPWHLHLGVPQALQMPRGVLVPLCLLLLLPLSEKRHRPLGHPKRRSYLRTESRTLHSVPRPGVLQGGCSARGHRIMLFCGHSLAWVCAGGDRSGKEEEGRGAQPLPSGDLEVTGSPEPSLFRATPTGLRARPSPRQGGCWVCRAGKMS